MQRQPVVKSINMEKVIGALRNCPPVILSYIKSLEGLVENQKQLQIKSLAKIRELSNTDWIEKMYLEIESQHPYKRSGNPESYSKYNEGWSDACCEFESKLEEHFRNTNK